ncbi:hypothetical protein OF83DRAFT_1131659 [Amylostereum chailletii]|nr:hypothetical protein OF83DRAFT_1131659 [Amylostereum chailletii]
MFTDFDDTLTNISRPKTSAILTIRVIKSFEYRTEKSLVLRDLNLEQITVGQLKDIVRQGPRLITHYPNARLRRSSAVLTQPGWKPYRTTQLDTLKLYSKAHGAKVRRSP